MGKRFHSDPQQYCQRKYVSHIQPIAGSIVGCPPHEGHMMCERMVAFSERKIIILCYQMYLGKNV